MQVIIDTEKGLSETDREAILVLLGITVTPKGALTASEAKAPAHTPSPEGAAAIERDAKPTKKTAAKKTAASRKPTSESPAAAGEAPAPKPAASEPKVASADAGDPLAEAKARAQAYMDADKRADVVSALAAVDVKRVSYLTAEQVPAFLDELPPLD